MPRTASVSVVVALFVASTVWADEPEAEVPAASEPAPTPAAGALSDADHEPVEAVVEKNEHQLKKCYKALLKANSEARGRVDVKWTITAGAVSAVEVVENDSGDDRFGACVVAKVGKWKFPAAITGEVEWPFRLN